MRWVSRILRGSERASEHPLQIAQEKFSNFLAILENNNRVLKIISDMEEKSHGDYFFDLEYIRSNLHELRHGVRAMTDGMIEMGGDGYAPLQDRYEAINDEITRVFPENRPVEEDEFTIPLELLGRDRSWSVGSKNAQLGEMKSALGLSVPEGFAISAWADKYFLDVNDLQARISECISSVNIKHYEDLVRVSEQIRAMVSSSEVPEGVAQSIRRQYAEARDRVGRDGFSLRSSAVGEDTLFSFAGQYATFLNVHEDEVVERYRDVLASRYSPQAIYYSLSRSFSEADLAMGVCCIAMVDAKCSGVIYTRDPVHPDEDTLVIYAVHGLGKFLVDGTLTPDTYRVSRSGGRVIDKQIVRKPIRMVLGRSSGTVGEPIPDEEQTVPTIDDDQAARLTELAVKIESHYGAAMDIEWSIDKSGQPYLLQARPLRMVETDAPKREPDLSGLEPVCSGGITVCPGAASGRVFHLMTTKDLTRVPRGAVLAAPLPFPGLVTVMQKVGALVTYEGSVASHTATLAREYGIPTLVGLDKSCQLIDGARVTVDATGGVIYAGSQPQLVRARRAESGDVDDAGIHALLRQVLRYVSPLNLLHPDDSDYTPENCRTFHDVTRFVHQLAMHEMFMLGQSIKKRDRIALMLKTDIPLKVRIIYIDRDPSELGGKRSVTEEGLASVPMEAFWSGVTSEPWPSHPQRDDLEGSLPATSSSLSTHDEGQFSETSFAVLSREYMILSLRMGYHFSTVEAMCTDVIDNNYIRFQVKGGGASVDRRSRRIRLLTELLHSLGFEHTGKGDFVDARIAYKGAEDTTRILRLLGRLTVLTKQLDMALSNKTITDWYIKDFEKKLGLTVADAVIQRGDE